MQHVCKNQARCDIKGCAKVHGVWEPKQEARFQKEANSGKKDASAGIVRPPFSVMPCVEF
jgi:hypothetical protein